MMASVRSLSPRLLRGCHDLVLRKVGASMASKAFLQHKYDIGKTSKGRIQALLCRTKMPPSVDTRHVELLSGN